MFARKNDDKAIYPLNVFCRLDILLEPVRHDSDKTTIRLHRRLKKYLRLALCVVRHRVTENRGGGPFQWTVVWTPRIWWIFERSSIGRASIILLVFLSSLLVFLKKKKQKETLLVDASTITLGFILLAFRDVLLAFRDVLLAFHLLVL